MRLSLPVLRKLALGAVFSSVLVVAACSDEADDVAALSTDPVIHGEGPGAPETFELANGMSVVVIPDRRAPVVTHMVWYRVGAADEPEGMSGIAHFLEHLMFKGTETIPPGELSRIVARNGGQDNAFTSSDYTAYFQRVAIDRLPIVMELEADRMENLVLSDAEVLPERDVVLEERRMRIDNNPNSILSEKINHVLFPVHPYGTPVIGWADEISALTTEDAIAYYDRFYTPNNATLVVAGDISAAELRPLAEKFYGSIERRAEPPARVRETSENPTEPLRVEYADKRVQQSTMRRLYRVPGYLNAPQGDAQAMEVLATILGGSATSRMYRSLVVEQQIAASAGSWYSGAALDDGTFGVYAVPAPGHSIAEVEQALDAELAAFLATGVSQEEVSRAAKLLMAEAIYARDSQEEMARIYGSVLATGGSISDVLEWPDRLRKVTPESVMAAAHAYLNINRSVTGILKPEGDT